MHTPNHLFQTYLLSTRLLISASLFLKLNLQHLLQLSKIFLTGMDCYSWLSKTALDDPLLVYQYSRALMHNELQEEDVNFFRAWESLLPNTGLKYSSLLVRKLEAAQTAARRGLFWQSIKPSDSLPNNIGKTRLLRKPTDNNGPKDQKIEGVMLTRKGLMRSGEGLIRESRTPCISGSLDRKLQERLMSTNWSPTVSGVLSIGDQKLAWCIEIGSRMPLKFCTGGE